MSRILEVFFQKFEDLSFLCFGSRLNDSQDVEPTGFIVPIILLHDLMPATQRLPFGRVFRVNLRVQRVGFLVIRGESNRSATNRIDVALSETAPNVVFLPSAFVIPFSEHLVPCLRVRARSLRSRVPPFGVRHHILADFQVSSVPPRKNRVPSIGSKLGETLVPIFRRPPSLRIGGNLYDLLPRRHFSQIVEKKRLYPSPDRFLVVRPFDRRVSAAHYAPS